MTRALALALFALSAVADEPKIEGMVVRAQVGGTVTMAGDSGADITPTGFLEVDGPLAFGDGAPLRFQATIGLTSLPGETLDLSNAETFKAGAVRLGISKAVGRMSVAGQELSTSVIAEWGFASKLPGDVEPAERLSRQYGVGVRLDEKVSGASVSLRYGRDEAAGDRGYGQWLVTGRVPIVGTKGLVFVRGDAVLSVGRAEADSIPGEPPVPPLKQRDIMRIGVFVDLAQAVEGFK